MELKAPLGKALIVGNGYPFSKSITQHKALLNQPLGKTETSIFKWNGYK